MHKVPKHLVEGTVFAGGAHLHVTGAPSNDTMNQALSMIGSPSPVNDRVVSPQQWEGATRSRPLPASCEVVDSQPSRHKTVVPNFTTAPETARCRPPCSPDPRMSASCQVNKTPVKKVKHAQEGPPCSDECAPVMMSARFVAHEEFLRLASTRI